MNISNYTLSQKDLRGFDELYGIYSASFPQSEQKPKEELFDMIYSPDYTVFISKADGKTAGFCIIFHSAQTSFYLLEYMAVESVYRGLGVGSKLFLYAISRVTEKYGVRPCLVEIDSPRQESQEQSVREKREQFYRRLGFRKIEPFDYILAIKSKETAPLMKILVYHSTIQNISKVLLREWLEDIYTLVYGCSKDDERISKMLFGRPQILKLL